MNKITTMVKHDIELDFDDMTEEKGSSRKKQTDLLKLLSKGSSTFHEIEWGLNIKDSIIYLHGDIGLGNLFDVISKVRIVLENRPKKNAKDPINVFINTNGGDVYEALGIIDYFESLLPIKVNVTARGRAMSAGAMILACATGARKAAKRTVIMLHEASGEFFGKSADIKATAEHFDKLEDDFYLMMAEKTGQSEEFWRKVCRKDFYITAAKAQELGIVDEVI